MGRSDIDTRASGYVLPTLPHPSAGKYKRVHAVLVKDGKFEIATKRSV